MKLASKLDHNCFNRWNILLGSYLFVISSILTVAPVLTQNAQVNVNRGLVVQKLQGNVTYYGRGTRIAQLGDRISNQGDGIITGADSAAILAVDTAIGTVNMAANTDLQLKQLTITAKGGRVTILGVNRGQARLNIRSFNNPESRLEIQSPAGVTAVRGTQFSVGVTPGGKTIVATTGGKVTASAQGKTVMVADGYGSIIVPGQVPTAPSRLRYDLDLKLTKKLNTTSGTVELRGKINPFNLISINDQPIDTSQDGTFNSIISLPTSRLLNVKVQDPLGRKRLYSLSVD